jgi:hypothetical protein
MYVLFSLCFVYSSIEKILRDNDTPPNTPRRARIAAQRNERDERTMDSPQRRRIPPQVPPPVIPPLHFNAPVPIPEPVSLSFSINLFTVLNNNIVLSRYNIITFLLISNSNMLLFLS